jgi:hypothetical protein
MFEYTIQLEAAFLKVQKNPGVKPGFQQMIA